MDTPAKSWPSRQHAGRFSALVALFAAAAAATGGTAFGDQASPVPTAVLSDFTERLQEYGKLREDLAKKLPPLSPTLSAADLQARQHALATALKQARAHARHGDLVPPAVQVQIRNICRADFARRSPSATRAALADVPEGPLPGINGPYPERAVLPTVPPLLLANLPHLPDNLQYRFYGRHLVIVDSDVQIVVDYVRNALPPH